MNPLLPLLCSAALLATVSSSTAQQSVPPPGVATPTVAPQTALPGPPAAAPVPSPGLTPPAQTYPSSAVPVPTALTTPLASPNAGILSPSYVIGPDDSIQVTVWKEPTLSGSFPVRPDGMISLPLVGDVLASGDTPMQLGTDLTARLKKFINDPNVTVSVLAVNSKRVFLLGEVLHVGALPLTPGMSPLQALAAAGGLSPYANAKHIYILRIENGKQLKIPFDFKKALKTGNMQGVSLVTGDTIVVP